MRCRSAVLGCLLVSSGALLAACTLAGLDGLAGPPVSDAATENSVDDAPASGDAATETATDASVDASPPCPHVFCADFDESNDVTNGWSNPELTGTGAVSLETSVFTSSPHAFAASLAPMANFEAALLAKYTKSSASSELHLDMRVYFDTLDVSSYAISLGVLSVFDSATSFSQVRIIVTAHTAELDEEYQRVGDEGQTTNPSSSPFTWPTKQWLQLHVDVTPTKASLLIDGDTYATVTKQGPWNESKTGMKLGLYYSAGQTLGQRVIYDDITFDTK